MTPRSPNPRKGPDSWMWVKCRLAAAFEDLEAPTHEKTGHTVATASTGSESVENRCQEASASRKPSFHPGPLWNVHSRSRRGLSGKTSALGSCRGGVMSRLRTGTLEQGVPCCICCFAWEGKTMYVPRHFFFFLLNRDKLKYDTLYPKSKTYNMNIKL